MTVENKTNIEPWIEEYDIDSREDPETWALELIETFNDTLRPGDSKLTVTLIQVVEVDLHE